MVTTHGLPPLQFLIHSQAQASIVKNQVVGQMAMGRFFGQPGSMVNEAIEIYQQLRSLSKTTPAGDEKCFALTRPVVGRTIQPFSV